MKFEYLLMNVTLTGNGQSDFQHVADLVEKAGDDGWELIAPIRCGDQLIHYFKRPATKIIKPMGIAG